MPNDCIQVYIVDDEPSICTAYARLVRSAKMQARTFTCVDDFMRSDITDENACVVSDIYMPGASGLDIPALLAQTGHKLPVIFVTGHDPREARDSAQSVGAAAYFRKPVDDNALLNAINWALQGDGTT